MKKFDHLIEAALAHGATRATMLKTSEIVFEPTLRDSCLLNHCGKYGKTWTCPPGVGEVSETMATLQGYTHVLLIQSVAQLEDSFDFEGMMAGSQIFKDIFLKVYETFDKKTTLPLWAGGCDLCPSCTYVENKPCRYPEKAISSVEAYGVQVNKTLEKVSIPYNNGTATVSYVGMIAF